MDMKMFCHESEATSGLRRLLVKLSVLVRIPLYLYVLMPKGNWRKSSPFHWIFHSVGHLIICDFGVSSDHVEQFDHKLQGWVEGAAPQLWKLLGGWVIHSTDYNTLLKRHFWGRWFSRGWYSLGILFFCPAQTPLRFLHKNGSELYLSFANMMEAAVWVPQNNPFLFFPPISMIMCKYVAL